MKHPRIKQEPPSKNHTTAPLQLISEDYSQRIHQMSQSFGLLWAIVHCLCLDTML